MSDNSSLARGKLSVGGVARMSWQLHTQYSIWLATNSPTSLLYTIKLPDLKKTEVTGNKECQHQHKTLTRIAWTESLGHIVSRRYCRHSFQCSRNRRRGVCIVKGHTGTKSDYNKFASSVLQDEGFFGTLKATNRTTSQITERSSSVKLSVSSGD